MRKDYQLTKIDIKALKSADSVCFDHDDRDGVAQLRAIKRADDSHPWEQTRAIAVDSSVTLYRGYNTDHSARAHCYHHVGSSQYDDQLQTIFGLLRENDMIALEWATCEPGHENGGYSGNAVCTLKGYEGLPLWRDDLTLVIRRDNGKRLTFHIDTRFTPNNSAKTIKIL